MVGVTLLSLILLILLGYSYFVNKVIKLHLYKNLYEIISIHLISEYIIIYNFFWHLSINIILLNMDLFYFK